MNTEQQKDLEIRVKDYQRFSMIFLMISLFLSIGFLLPEQSELMQSGIGISLWLTTFIGAVFCMLYSRKWQHIINKKDE